MRVLLAADFYPPAPGGLEAHVRRLAHGLARAGHDVAVIAGGAGPGTAGRADDEGVPVHRVGSDLDRLPLAYREPGRAFHPPWPDRVFGAAVGAAVRDFAPDLVHAHGWCAYSAVAAAGRRPVVVTLHDHGLRCPKKNLLRAGGECARGRGLRCATCPGREQGTVKRCLLSAALAGGAHRLTRRVARFLAVSQHVARRHLEAYPHAAPVQVIPNFLDLPDAPFTPPAGSQVLFVGPADRHKGLSVLLAAGRLLPPGLAGIVVVGTAGRADGVHFAGRLTGAALWRRYREAALVVAPPIWPDPCPTVVLEALAAGRPVVGSRAGGIPDLVDPTCGVLVPPGDAPALAAAVTALLTDRPRLAALARGAFDRAPLFATPAVVGRIIAVYDDVLTVARR